MTTQRQLIFPCVNQPCEGAEVGVLETRRRQVKIADGIARVDCIVRRRVCYQCGGRYKSVELTVEQVNALINGQSRIRELIELADQLEALASQARSKASTVPGPEDLLDND